MNKEKVQELLDFVRMLPDAKCHMPSYAKTEVGKGIPGVQKRKSPNECGTAACIAGWSALIQAPSVDLKLKTEGRYAHSCGMLYVPMEWAMRHKLTWYEGNNQTYRGKTHVAVSMHSIGMAVLGLTERQADRIFALEGVEDLDETESKQYMVDMLQRLLEDPEFQNREEPDFVFDADEDDEDERYQ